MFGPFASAQLNLEKLRRDLRRARLPIRAEAYAAFSLTSTAIAFVATFIVAGFAAFVLLPQLGISPGHPIALMSLVLSPILVAGAVWAILFTSPASKAKQRGNNLDAYLPYALNYVAAMASAGVPIYEIFRSLAAQDIYGEVSTEARWITKDIFLGTDSVTAMRRAAERSPSQSWGEVLQGAITSVTSGGDLKAYFAQKAERYAFENRQEQRQFVDVMGLMAETYVTAAVAGPLFLIVMLAIMAMLGSGEPGILYVITYAVLPLINAGFAFGLVSMSPKV